MKKIGLGESITILSNIGVLVGIGFLAIEIQQTNDLMEFEASFNRLSISSEARNILSTNGDLAEINVKVDNREPLTEVEEYRFRQAQLRFLGNMEWMLREMPENSRDWAYAERQLRDILRPDGLRRQVFLNSKDILDPEFVSWVESNILAT